ncbi:cupin domain-containing protein [Synechococcus moorigangaii CMS01]|nr:cupin domain-containing protein [Synechococcus moorigangaii CMS01]
MALTAAAIIDYLQLEPHMEGGYFRETYRSTAAMATPRVGGDRQLLTSIYYLLSRERPLDYLHRNQSPIMHYFHGGAAITYHTLSPAGEWQTTKLGFDLAAGEVPQLLVPGGYWKTAILETGEFGLLGEAVAPGFDYRDLEVARGDQLQALYPTLWPQLQRYIHPEQSI